MMAPFSMELLWTSGRSFTDITQADSQQEGYCAGDIAAAVDATCTLYLTGDPETTPC
jgi:hypothetical protein